MLQQLTKQLVKECDACIERFWHMREQDAVPDFFRDVKPHADQWHAHIAQWQQAAYAFIEQHAPKYMHKTQIDAAKEAFEQFVVQSFYKETSKKRFEQSVLSVKYTCTVLQTCMEEAAYVE